MGGTAAVMAPAFIRWLSPYVVVCLGGPANVAVGVFGFGLMDTSLQGAIHGLGLKQRQPLAGVGEEPRRRLAHTRRLEVVDVAPLAGHSADQLRRLQGGVSR
jgi:hypothetical protein